MPVVFVLLDHPALPSDVELRRALRGFQRDAAISNITTTVSPDATLLSFELEHGEKVLAALVPIPVPNREADDDVRYSISAAGTGWKLPPHHAHVIVTLQAKVTRNPKRYARFTTAVAAIVATTNAVGVYWGPASATHDPNFFLKVVRSGTRSLLASIWVGVDIVGPTPTTVSLLSIGMPELGYKDLLLAAKRSRKDVLGTFYDVISYLIDRGAPIPAGETIGQSATERFPVRYVKSPTEPKTQVMSVDMR